MITKLRRAASESWPHPDYQLAHAIRVSPTLMSFYMNGRYPISAHHLIALCKILRRNPTDLVGYDETG